MKISKQAVIFASILLLASCAQEPSTDDTNAQTSAPVTTLPNQQVIAGKTVNNSDNHKQQSNQQAVLMVEEKMAAHVIKTRKIRANADMVLTQSYHQPLSLPQHPITHVEKYRPINDHGINLTSAQPVSTFSIDVDTASYANVRRLLNQGRLPQYDAVRVEELINYFSYDYPIPSGTKAKHPFTVHTEVAPSPFNADKKLIHIGIKGKVIEHKNRPASNLVFLIDISGSMNRPNKIGLLKHALKMLTKQLTQQDKVAIVVYAGAAGVVLEPTAGDNHYAIVNALENLSAGGSTNGGAGIQVAYHLAEQSFISTGINRVIIATDGDFNVGTVDQQALKKLIEQKRDTGITLSVLGFGQGNYNDALMQALAQNGNGNAYYIDTLNEARKVLVEELSATLMVIAKDVKIQLEFNPNVVSEYRLIGYETRALTREDFNNDKVDAGEIGAGHTVTALYEVSFVGASNHSIDPLRYQTDKGLSGKNQPVNNNEEIAYLRLRYKLPKQVQSKLIEAPILLDSVENELVASSDNFRFSAAVAGYGQLLRGGKNLSTLTLEQVIDLAQNAKGSDKYGYRSEFINMVKLTQAIAPVKR